ncbi:1-phosphatidylinositol 4,5-bisphosphate phosphodiesterase delta-4-like [Anneissia japonica]|uniref:1-phosphatidylinositol 4,5-bisphosphate phosphodiesterase delta-4-like n=1 Tax=Anneissia japonica TaxID=1529436 RepID=UPI0014256365|nr:1-phosphatidylinositol 4,5-bisphosphate phosphodiesterase delta-4-like [Anneissia japonica]
MDDPLINKLTAGTQFTKIKDSGSSKYYTFSLNTTRSVVTYIPTQKKSGASEFTLDNIRELQAGNISKAARSKKNRVSLDRCFSIVFNNTSKTLDLAALSAEDAKSWIDGLRLAKKQSIELDVPDLQDRWLRRCFDEAHSSKDHYNFEECKALLETVGVSTDTFFLEKILKTVVQRNQGPLYENTTTLTLNAAEFVQLYRTVTSRDDLLNLFVKYAGGNDFWMAYEFLQFMHEEQKRFELKEEWCDVVISKYEPISECRKRRVLSYDGFFNFMHGANGQLINPYHRYKVNQDMTLPLNHYFIAASHNTYLTQDQFSQPCTSGYVDALRKGSRFVEVDVWNGDDGEPVVYNGYTSTKPILFTDVIRTINKHAFVMSEYPLIVSIENHCNIRQQKIILEHLNSILKDKLYKIPLHRNQRSLPSPNDLKGKVIVKGRRLQEFMEEGEVSDDDEAADMENVKVPEIKKNLEKQNEIRGEKVKLSLELSDVAVLCQSVTFRSLEHSKKEGKFCEVASIPEKKAAELGSTAGQQFVDHNKQFLTRIYPGGWRTDSSNPDPTLFWNLGCSIVSINYQSPGEFREVNNAKFLQNGQCGYILKPLFLRKGNMKFNPDAPGTQHACNCTIKIISGQFLPALKIDNFEPIVKVTLYDVNKHSTDETNVGSMETQGVFAYWHHEINLQLVLPELSILRFTLYDNKMTSSNDYIAQYALPFKSLQLGYHHISLLSPTEEDLKPASLFVHVKILTQ